MANNAQLVAYQGYPAAGAVAVKNEWAGDHFGPGAAQGNYQQGGYNITPAQLGMSRIEFVNTSYVSQSGNYFARVVYPANISGNGEQFAPGFNSVTIKWFYQNNNAEVANNTNLFGEVVQMLAIGL